MPDGPCRGCSSRLKVVVDGLGATKSQMRSKTISTELTECPYIMQQTFMSQLM